MPKVVGIDPGTKSFGLCGLNDGEVFFEEIIPTSQVLEAPHLIMQILDKHRPLDLVVGPSGFGLPLTQLSKLKRGELYLTVLVKPSDVSRKAQLGLKKVLKKLKDSDMDIYILPSVKHLTSVPLHRKINKIDMGTADKVCVAALAISEQAKYHSVDYESTSFILAELGFSFNAYLTIEKGQIIDGIGGSLANIGFLSRGHVDAELVYLLGEINKSSISKGGAAYIAGMKAPDLEIFVEKKDQNERHRSAWEALMEGIEKDISQMQVSAKNSPEIILSGRITHTNELYLEISNRLSKYGKIRRLEGFAKNVKEAAQGAALIADGLAGGRFKKLVDTLRLKSADGNILDQIYLDNIAKERTDFNNLIHPHRIPSTR